MSYAEGDETGKSCAGDAAKTQEANGASWRDLGSTDLGATEEEGCPGFLGPLHARVGDRRSRRNGGIKRCG